MIVLRFHFFRGPVSVCTGSVFAGHLHSGRFLTKLWFVLAPTSWWNRPVVCSWLNILSDLLSHYIFVFKMFSLFWHEDIKYSVRRQKSFERVNQTTALASLELTVCDWQDVKITRPLPAVFVFHVQGSLHSWALLTKLLFAVPTPAVWRGHAAIDCPAAIVYLLV